MRNLEQEVKELIKRYEERKDFIKKQPEAERPSSNWVLYNVICDLKNLVGWEE
jgi:hypothetical protein